MSNEAKDEKPKEGKKLSLGGKLQLKGTAAPVEPAAVVGTVKQSFTHGRSKTVAVEIKRKRDPAPGETKPAQTSTAPTTTSTTSNGQTLVGLSEQGRSRSAVIRTLTNEERAARVQALRGAIDDEKQREEEMRNAPPTAQTGPRPGDIVTREKSSGMSADTLRARELEELRQIQEFEKQQAKDIEAKRIEEESKRKKEEPQRAQILPKGMKRTSDDDEDDAPRANKRRTAGKVAAPAAAPTKRDTNTGKGRNSGKVMLSQIQLSGADGEVEVMQRTRSLASARRAREKQMRQMMSKEQVKIVRDIVIPEFITVQELANRMAERAGDVIKSLMKLGVMATITQTIDADTAELVASEFGHRYTRVAEADVEIGLDQQTAEKAEDLLPRAPVVTIMGHVDHGKTSLLDAIRKTNVVARESGGITQHIGAYQVEIPKGKITFIDTPGHAAFTEMRARGANVTDIVILVVAANDGVMPQTVEAITHAKAANVPIIVAINKADLPTADANRVRQGLLQYDVQVEEMGGETLSVEVSAKTGKNLDKLLETVLLQAEVLDLKANPNRTCKGVVIEAQMDKGRGAVATILVQQGTLRTGDIVVSGIEQGRVRAIVNDHGKNLDEAMPAQPVEVLGLGGVPLAGDDFVVVASEARAREITDFRKRRKLASKQVASATKSSLEEMFTNIREGVAKEVPVLIKGDVQGSVEAIRGALDKLAGDSTEVKVKVLDATVGAISESDVILAKASNALIIGFNVRANPQARDLAKRDAVDIRYYSIIYNILDDVKGMLSGLLAPDLREKFLGYASILQVFNITKAGKVAGCKVTEGIVKRGAKVRLLRDSVVIHEGMLKTLKRMKDEVKEVREGYECGMAFENYDNIQEGDQIECFEVEEVARQL
ncbi:MAG: translation initiation factor IF-2 [Alphaproteobacteria bacterium]|nr:translation initiation factor IF-2 [Alphaproteobacteria bacterium]